ncbi:unnamed protein product [Rangifer tarandus platyrhynchus]|uniref:Uncharacterized protein n=1 Tax=Rangifer tarandus platyrhynchus TaxID=3082113 RepID=A0AC59YEX3_RANTA
MDHEIPRPTSASQSYLVLESFPERNLQLLQCTEDFCRATNPLSILASYPGVRTRRAVCGSVLQSGWDVPAGEKLQNFKGLPELLPYTVK